MKPIFKFTPKDAHSTTLMIEPLVYQEDFQTFVRGNVGNQLTVTLELSAKKSEKEKIYAFYHKVILNVAMQYYRSIGWESMDKVKADYFLKAECGKDVMYNSETDEEEVYLLDKSRMNKKRLSQFVTDCITFLEVECGCPVPDSASYLLELNSGMSGFQSINKKDR